MLTSVERVMILKGADLLNDVGPRRLLGLANVAREVEVFEGDKIYGEEDPADALYMVVEGRVRLSTGERTMSEVGPGEAFGTWSLVDDSARGHRAECIADGLTLALHRDEFYDVAAGDLTLLQEVVRALAKRLRALVAERPEEARVEGEGVETPEALVEAATATAPPAVTPPPAPGAAVEAAPAPTPGAALAAAALGSRPPRARRSRLHPSPWTRRAEARRPNRSCPSSRPTPGELPSAGSTRPSPAPTLKERPVDALKPRKSNGAFFGRFEDAARNNVEAAKLLDHLCHDFANAEGVVRQLHDLEHKGDEITHDIYLTLNKVFMPPLDREDIIAITSALDDVIDHIHEAADAMCVYNVKAPTSFATSLAAIIVACTEAVAKELPKLRQRREMRSINEGVIEIHRLENQADTLLRQGVMDLFHRPNDPIQVIAWSRIYETMEQVTDKCEDIADVLRGLVIKHA